MAEEERRPTEGFTSGGAARDGSANGGRRGPAPTGATGATGATRATAVPASTLAGLGIQFAVAVVVFLFAGRWLDARLGTTPWLQLIGMFLGAGGAFYSMYRKVTAAPRREPGAGPTGGTGGPRP